MELLKKLSELPGISGREDEVRTLIHQELEKSADEVEIDKTGNVIAHKEGKSDRKLMICAHMDEIGFLVRHIDDNGFIRLREVGGFDPRVLLARRVTIHGKEKVNGIIGTKPLHLMTEKEKKKEIKIKDLFVDTGRSAEEIKEIVSMGDMITYQMDFKPMGEETFSGKCLDDRLGVYTMIKVFEKIKAPEVDLYAVASVQEEVGLRGAQVSSFDIEPDLGLALDVTVANDVPGGSGQDKVTELGEGTAIKIMDSVTISNHKLVTFLRKLAEENDIDYQMEILPGGGTDAGAIERSRSGIPVGGISTPIRYAHSGLELAKKGDLEASIELIKLFIEKSHSADFSY